MGRHRKPTAVLELTGAFKKDPQRRRDWEPKVEGPLGEAPRVFCDDEELLAIWDELNGLAPANVLTSADRWLVEVACRLMRSLRFGDCSGSEKSLLISCLARMGMTPSDRSRVAVETAKEQSERDELAELARESGLRPN